MDTRANLVAAEDVLFFVNAAITSTGQREFRSDAAEQRMSLQFLHAYVQGNYRELYAATLALDINDHNAALIIHRLLADTAGISPGQRRTEGRLIARRLAAMPPQRVYRLFARLRTAKVNNRRTRAIMRDWLAARPDPAFDAVKYRSGVKTAARHAHLPTRGELGDFLFAPRARTRYDHPLLDTYRRARYTQAALYELPFTVAEGFAAKHRIPRRVFLDRIAPGMTRLERLRLQESAREARAGEVAADLGRMPLTRLASYVLALPLDTRAARRAELTAALRTAARRAAGDRAGTWGPTAAVLDDSFSTAGSTQKRRRPLAVALAAHYLLAALAPRHRTLWTSGRTDELLLYPYGPTPLGLRILDALEPAPERLVIVSDGWDNAPPGLAGEVLRAWRERLDPEERTAVVHLNPVYDADAFDVHRLSPAVPTAGIRDAEDLPALVELAAFATGRTGPAELRAHLDRRVARFLEDPR
ncbi:hypothetical protein SRB5_12610 [Streptomyces sp. RB5]|uniref:TROVE domain-containing protein n=1 Tax=Streptomyces smaragdinus TaxID=2585196 RepID=A0A7K0CCG6_9ACTN|nr:hypothetical protein [Streptomyces smaragdinus]MQY11147.1 hypothetical protein [Streptomyces smaragdinus]